MGASGGGGRVHPVRAQKSAGLAVIIGGLVTTALALGLVGVVGAVSGGTVNWMGYYLWHIVPVSAIAVGAAAGSGYAIASWARGVRVTGGLLVAVLSLTVVGYFGAHYVEYRTQDIRHEGRRIGYWEYFDLETRAATFTSTYEDPDEASPVGLWGYGLRVLELVGFSLGGLIPLFFLATRPFCGTCQRYLRTEPLCAIPAAAKKRKLLGDPRDRGALEKEHSDVARKAEDTLEQLSRAAAEGDVRAFRSVMEPLKPGSGQALHREKRLVLSLRYCPSCYGGHIRVQLGVGPGTENNEDLRPVPADPAFLRHYLLSLGRT